MRTFNKLPVFVFPLNVLFFNEKKVYGKILITLSTQDILLEVVQSAG